jgi:hypothetical protein
LSRTRRESINVPVMSGMSPQCTSRIDNLVSGCAARSRLGGFAD